ncbi:MAG: hypothetical protein AAFX08_08435 [Pseudomonadota bacterium]
MTFGQNRLTSVRELQRAASRVGGAIRNRDARRPSRAAQLRLIDNLSRSGDAGIAILVGASAASAALFAGPQTGRAAVWIAMVFFTAYASGRLRRAFRRGDKIAGRPFRWRANYAASLAALSAAVGAGAILLNPRGADAPAAPEVMAAIAAAGAAAGWFHRAHRPSAIAVSAPASLFVALAAMRGLETAPLYSFAAASIAALGLIVVAHAADMSRRAATIANPRSRMPRRSETPLHETARAARA